MEIRLCLLTIDGKFETKYPSGKTLYLISADSEQEPYYLKL